MRYADICAGISASTVAWHPLGWKASFYSEIDKFPSAVLAHHYPETPNYGDMTRFEEWPDADIDVLIGGTPCQGFSIAGLRKGLDDDRSNLALCFALIARRYKPRWVVWENVPGVRSANGGRDLGSFLGGLAELGYGLCWRSLDAQYAGLAQRRERLFVVGYLGDWRRAAAVLLEPEGLRWDSAPRREKGQGTAHELAPCIGASGRGFERAGETRGQDPVVAVASTGDTSHCLNAGGMRRQDYETETLISQPYTLAIRGRDGTPDLEYRQDGTANAILTPNGGRAGMGVGAIAFSCKDHGADANALSPTLRAMGHSGSHANAGGQVAVAYDFFNITAPVNRQNRKPGDPCHTLGRDNADRATIIRDTGSGWAVRRLTPRECERLMGYEDDYTLIPYRGKPASDGPRYKALGNSIAVPCLRWIGERIMLCEEASAILQSMEAA